MFTCILNRHAEEDDGIETSPKMTGVEAYEKGKQEAELHKEKTELKKKIEYMNELLKNQRVIREQRESILKLKYGTSEILLPDVSENDKNVMQRFLKYKSQDSANEKWPEYSLL